MNVRVDNKVVVIIGGSGGIGRKLVYKFAEENAQVIYTYKSNPLVLYNNTNYNNVQSYKVDVRSKTDIHNLRDFVRMRHGRIDILINNAGITCDNPIEKMEIGEWSDVVNTNLIGVMNCCEILSSLMTEKKCGKIFNIASMKGQRGSRHQSNYAASKSAIIGYTIEKAAVLGVNNVCMNAVCPGFIETDLNRKYSYKKLEAIQSSSLTIDNCLDDLVSFIVFMSSDHISSISGKIFNVDSRQS